MTRAVPGLQAARRGGGPLERVGGQAVIEGVMMKSPVGAAVAARDPDGTITARRLDMDLLSDGPAVWSKPVFRGAATFLDTLRLGLKALEWSALRQESGGTRRDRSGSTGTTISTGLAVLAALALFLWLPLQLSRWLLPDSGSQVLLHLLAGSLRIVFFVGYILLISLHRDVKRVFVYHGAEHQCIHAYEAHGLGLSPDSAARFSPIHSRCGTSFMLLLVLVTVVLYAMIDTVVIMVTGADVSPLVRLLYHVPLMPLVVGVSYEALRAVDRHLDTSPAARMLAAPGLALQRLTTRRADRDEVQVAIAALMVSLGKDPGEGVSIEEEDDGNGREGPPGQDGAGDRRDGTE